MKSNKIAATEVKITEENRRTCRGFFLEASGTKPSYDIL